MVTMQGAANMMRLAVVDGAFLARLLCCIYLLLVCLLGETT